MDVQTIDNQYAQLQQQSQQTVQALQTLGNKLQAASQGGDQQAREWLLDLRELALSFRAEQDQTASLLQALHGYVASQAQQVQQAPQGNWGGGNTGGFVPPQQQGGYPQQAPQQGGGMFGNFLNSGFGRALEQGAGMGVGFGIADDVIKDIF